MPGTIKQKQNLYTKMRRLIGRKEHIFIIAISVVIVVLLIAGMTIYSGMLKTSITKTATADKNTLIKVSNTGFSSDGEINIYFLSWQGSPIGAADSWIIYNYVHTQDPSLSNSTIYKNMSISDPDESPNNIPGLMINDFSYTLGSNEYNFHVIYVYGKYLPQAGQNSISQGETILNANFPPSVSSLFIKYETHYPVSELNGESIANYSGHLTSSFIITGQLGTYYLGGELYNVSAISGRSARNVINTLSQYSGITSSTSELSKTVNQVFNSSVSKPTAVQSGKFIRINNSDVSPVGGVNIYFLSWQGCPIGASDSWFIYNYVHSQDPSLSNSTIYHDMHFSDPDESPNNIPGLLFNNFSYSLNSIDYNFHVVYVYGEYLPGYGPNTISQGESVLNANFPSSVSSLFLKYETQYPTVNLSGEAIANYAGHLTSSFIVTGPYGTYYAEGEIYNPTTITGIQPDVLINELSQYSGITTGTSELGTAVNSVI